MKGGRRGLGAHTRERRSGLLTRRFTGPRPPYSVRTRSRLSLSDTPSQACVRVQRPLGFSSEHSCRTVHRPRSSRPITLFRKKMLRTGGSAPVQDPHSMVNRSKSGPMQTAILCMRSPRSRTTLTRRRTLALLHLSPAHRIRVSSYEHGERLRDRTECSRQAAKSIEHKTGRSSVGFTCV